jgi:tRNA wybutosine-synthesizing protein 2
MHEATPEGLVPDRPVNRLQDAVEAAGRELLSHSITDVKGYSEGVRHVVVDAEIR